MSSSPSAFSDPPQRPQTGPAAGPRRAGPPPRTPARTTGPSPPWPDARRTRRPTPSVARRGARVGRPPPLAPGRCCPRPRRPRPLFPDSSLSLHTHLAVCQSLTAVRASFPRARRPAKMKEPNVNGSAGGGRSRCRDAAADAARTTGPDVLDGV